MVHLTFKDSSKPYNPNVSSFHMSIKSSKTEMEHHTIKDDFRRLQDWLIL